MHGTSKTETVCLRGIRCFGRKIRQSFSVYCKGTWSGVETEEKENIINEMFMFEYVNNKSKNDKVLTVCTLQTSVKNSRCDIFLKVPNDN